MSTLIRIDTLIESLRAQLERGAMTYAGAIVTEEFLTLLEQTRDQVMESHRTLHRPGRVANKFSDGC